MQLLLGALEKQCGLPAHYSFVGGLLESRVAYLHIHIAIALGAHLKAVY